MDSSLWGQLTLAGIAFALLLTLGRVFVAYVERRVSEDREQHREELKRLTESWEARLADQRETAKSWEASSRSLQKTCDELADQMATLLPGMTTMVRLVEAIREEQLRR